MCELFVLNMYELLSNEGIRDILQTQIINFPTWSDMFPIVPSFPSDVHIKNWDVPYFQTQLIPKRCR